MVSNQRPFTAIATHVFFIYTLVAVNTVVAFCSFSILYSSYFNKSDDHSHSLLLIYRYQL